MIILASASPRRVELFSRLGFEFVQKEAAVDEKQILRRLEKNLPAWRDDLSPTVVAEALARAKAEEIARNETEAIVVGADTVVVLDRKILGKPSGVEEAKAMLRSLLGKEHEVITAVCLRYQTRTILFHERCKIDFYEADALTLDFIDRYCVSGKPLDKAGAYGIQDEGALLVRRIEGDYYNVMGLPLAKVWRELHALLQQRDTIPKTSLIGSASASGSVTCHR